MKIRKIHERFYGRHRPGMLVCVADRRGRILYSAWPLLKSDDGNRRLRAGGGAARKEGKAR